MKKYKFILVFVFINIFFIHTCFAVSISNKKQQQIAQKQKNLAQKKQKKQKLGKLQRLNRWNAKVSNIFKAEGLVKKLSAKKLVKVLKAKGLAKKLKRGKKFEKFFAAESFVKALYLDLGSIEASNLAEDSIDDTPEIGGEEKQEL